MDSTFDESIASAHCPEVFLTYHKQVLDLANANTVAMVASISPPSAALSSPCSCKQQAGFYTFNQLKNSSKAVHSQPTSHCFTSLPAIIKSSWFSLGTAVALNQGRRMTMLILSVRTLNITSCGTSRNTAIPQVAEMYLCLQNCKI